MKKNIFIGIALAILAVGCTKENIGIENTEPNLVEFTLTTVAPEFADEETKTYLGEGGSVNWNMNDVIYTGQGTSKFELTNVSENGGSAVFTGTIDLSKFKESYTSKELFIHSKNLKNGWKFSQDNTGQKLEHVYIPNIQTMCANTFDPEANLSVAEFDLFGEDKTINFVNASSLLGIELKGDAKIKSIKIEEKTLSEKKCKLTGAVLIKTFSKQVSGKVPEGSILVRALSLGNDQTSTNQQYVTLIMPENSSYQLTEEAVRFYACVLPGYVGDNYSAINNIVSDNTVAGATATTYTVTIANDAGKTISTDVTLDQSIKPGHIGVLGRFNVTQSMFDAVQ